MSGAKSKQARELARMRVEMVRTNERRELARLRQALKDARSRRRAALRAALKACAKARRNVQDRISAYRARELARLRLEVRQMRRQARARCQARCHRIRVSGGTVVEKRRAELLEYARHRRQMARLSASHGRRELATYRERLQEDDDAVRSNLPRELLGVFERVKRVIKGSRHKTRTEAFLEWAESHPEDVLAYQGDETDREVRRLVAEHEAAERQLRKTVGKARSRRAVGLEEVPF